VRRDLLNAGPGLAATEHAADGAALNAKLVAWLVLVPPRSTIFHARKGGLTNV
jgi:hypothetical protein